MANLLKVHVRQDPRYANIPLAPHRILVLGWGRLDRHGSFHYHQPCCYVMRLHHCCAKA